MPQAAKNSSKSSQESCQSVSQFFHGAPRSPLHRLSVRFRRSRSNTSTEYSLPGATQTVLSIMYHSVSPVVTCHPHDIHMKMIPCFEKQPSSCTVSKTTPIPSWAKYIMVNEQAMRAGRASRCARGYRLLRPTANEAPAINTPRRSRVTWHLV